MKILFSIFTILLAATDSTGVQAALSFSDHILNGLDSGFYWACVFAAYVTYALRTWWLVDYAAKNNPRTPQKKDWAYFWNNNTKRILRDLFTIPVIVLLYPQLLDMILTWAQGVDAVPDWLGQLFDRYDEVTVAVSAVIGFLYRNLVAWARKRKWLKKQAQTNNPLG